MSGPREREQGKWAVAVACLLREPTIQAAADRAGVGESTIRRWLSKPAFKRLYREARREVVENAIAQLQAATAKAVDVLKRNMDCGQPAAEIRAACAVIDQAVRGVELIDVESRLSALEQADRTDGMPAERASTTGKCR